MQMPAKELIYIYKHSTDFETTIALGLLKTKEEEFQFTIFDFMWCVCKLCYYGDVIHSFDWKSAVERDGGA